MNTDENSVEIAKEKPQIYLIVRVDILNVVISHFMEQRLPVTSL